MKGKLFAVLLVGFLFLDIAYAVDSYTFQYGAVNGTDTWIYSGSADTNYNGNQNMLIRGGQAEILMRFNSSCYSLPPGFIPETVELTLTEDYYNTDILSVYAMNHTWGEATITWNSCGSGGACNGWFIPQNITYFAIDKGATWKIRFNETWFYNECQKDQTLRHGFIILAPVTAVDFTSFFTSDHATPSNHPKLEVNGTIFMPPDEIKIFLKNNTGYLDFLNINENDRFNIYVNFSNSGISYTSAVCNFSSNNISAFFANSAVTNTTLNDPDDIVQLTIQENPLNVISDTFSFRVCHELIKTPMEIYINGTLFKTVDQNVIPSCDVGYHEEINEITSQKNNRSVNISLKCSNCDVNDVLTILPDDMGEKLTFNRYFSNHTEDLDYNITSGLWQFNEHLYRYDRPMQTTNMIIKCNETTNVTSFDVGDVSPIIKILSIDDMSYFDGIYIESSNFTTIVIDVSGDIVSSIEFNVTFSNGSLIKTTSEEFMILTNDNLSDDNNYTIKIRATDINGNISSLKGYFQLNDTVLPVIKWTVPSNDNSTVFTVDGTSNLYIELNDVNLFAYEVLIYDPNTNLRYNFTQIGISGNYANITDAILTNETGKWILDLTVTDAHTLQKIEDYQYSIYEKVFDKKSVQFNFEEIKDHRPIRDNVTIDYIGSYVVDDLEMIKNFDRYQFRYTFNMGGDKSKEVNHRYRIQCKDIYFISDSSYPGHFVCYSAKKWVDFNSPDVIRYYVEECGNNCYELELTTLNKDIITFESIGGLNTVFESKAINVELPPNERSPLIFDFDIDNTANVFALFVIAFLWVSMMALGFFFKNFGFASIGFFIGIILGFILFSVHVILTLVFVLLNAFMFIKYAHTLK